MSLSQKEFNLSAGMAERDYGKASAAARRRELLELARDLAERVALATADRRITADDVRRALIDAGHEPDELGNAAGSVFRTEKWRFTGEWTPSTVRSRHAGMLRVWELR